jgi:Domain of unknown function (4846)
MELPTLILITPLLLLSCNQSRSPEPVRTASINSTQINPFKQIQSIPLPTGFERVKADSDSFCGYLRNIVLKKQTTVYLFNGQPKHNQTAQYALLNISVGNTDLQQCADAVMRLRAEYLFEQKLFDQIVFFDNANTAYKFTSPGSF